MDIRSFWSLIGKSAHILVILACFASVHASTLQDAVIREGCSKYQDPKTIEPLKKFVEPALQKEGCVACHLDCNQLSPAQQKEPPEYYLKAKEPALCMECHASLGKDLSKAHDNQPLDKSRCSSCHDPHSSDTPKILVKYSHGPYAARLCSDCHPAPENGEVVLVAPNVDSLCYKCHSNFKAEIAGTKSQHKMLSESDRSCMECHNPHAANREYVLKKPAQELCLNCHVEPSGKAVLSSQNPSEPSQDGVDPSKQLGGNKAQYLKLSAKYVHEPARKSCLICHDAHASDFPKELRVSVSELCMGCHGPNSEKIIQSSQPFPLFNGLVSLPPKSFEKLDELKLWEKYIHEPVNVSCAICHDAHASDYPSELIAPLQEVCLSCHGLNAEMIVRSEQATSLFGGKVVLPPKTFKKMTMLRLRYGNLGHPTSNHPVSAPAAEDKPELNCVTCHASHSSSTGNQRMRDVQERLCNTLCHSF